MKEKKMNILFLSLGEFDSLESGSVHVDLMKRIADEHNMFLVCKREKRNGKKTELETINNLNILHVKTGNIKNTGLLEKGISTILLENQFLRAIKLYFYDVKFDLVLYTTPPITFAKVVKYVKRKYHATSYLMLKDIFPQNAVDMGMLKKTGILGIIYRFFRLKEKLLYRESDYIGCMSDANVEYIIKHNKLKSNFVEVCPNCILPTNKEIGIDKRNELRAQYGLPLDKKICIYGGNLGKPQGIDFLINCLESQSNNKDVFFVIIGSGTEYQKIQKYISLSKQSNVKLMDKIPRNDYDTLVASCDIGMIFLDYRFTIPNFPSRILSYMQAHIPIIAVTDKCTDVGKIIVDNKFGWWCESNNVLGFDDIVSEISIMDTKVMGDNGYNFLLNNYHVDIGYKIIMSHFIQNE